MDPTCIRFAQQAAIHAQLNPGNPKAQRTARYWADVAQFQQRMPHGMQQGAQAAPAVPGLQLPSPIFAATPGQASATAAPASQPVHAMPPALTSRQHDPLTGASNHHGSEAKCYLWFTGKHCMADH